MKAHAITPRSTNFSDWYQDVIRASDLAEHSAVRGCMIIKPWGMGLWEALQKQLDHMIKETGHKNVYFPMLIPLRFFQQEAEHIDGFAKECAVVTHHRLEKDADGQLIPAPDAQLQEPFVIRPTSETIIGDAMSRWVSSYRDLPVKINQWCNVMRWEMRPRLFLRTSEFLWQEGHTAHATQEEAVSEASTMLDVYETFVQDHLAIPVIKGRKTPSERFPGAVETFTIEAMMQDGKALQAGTSHFLGQKFSRAYNISYSDKDQQRSFAWTTSWGATTRLIGAVVMSHSDDYGLVLPPRIAPEQVRIIPIIKDSADEEMILAFCHQLCTDLGLQMCFGEGIRAAIDTRDRRPVDKFWEAVTQGVPLRLEIGKKEVEARTVSLSQRNHAPKERTNLSVDAFIAQASSLLEEMQAMLFQQASQRLQERIHTVTSVAEIQQLFAQQQAREHVLVQGFFDLTQEENPAVMEQLTTLKITPRCIPFAQDDTIEGRCIFSGHPTTTQVIFGVAY